MKNIRIVTYHENDFYIMPGANDETFRDKNVAVAVEPTLLYKKGSDAVGCQLLIEYSIDGRTVIAYSAVITVRVNGWAKFLKKDSDDNDKVAATREAWDAVLDFARGAICANAVRRGSTFVTHIMLPVFDIDKFLQDVNVQEV